MKRIFLIIIIIALSYPAFSQTLPQTDSVKLITKEDYKLAEPMVLKAGDYLLSTPSDQNNPLRLKAGQFIFKWMNGTDDFTFTLEQNILQYIEADLDLMSTYFACITTYSIKNRSVTDTKTVTLNAVKKLAAYIDNGDNHVSMTSGLKKLSKANQKGELEKFLEF